MPAAPVHFGMRAKRVLRRFFPVLVLAGARLAGASADQACLDCHTDQTLTMQKGKAQVSLFADPAVLAKSVHGSLKCADCHEGFDATAIPHKASIGPVDCASCHEDSGAKHAFHSRLGRSPVPQGADTACASCHGTHGIASPGAADSPSRAGARPNRAGAATRRPARSSSARRTARPWPPLRTRRAA